MEELLKLKFGDPEYQKKQNEFVEKFKQVKKESKESEEKFILTDLINDNISNNSYLKGNNSNTVEMASENISITESKNGNINQEKSTNFKNVEGPNSNQLRNKRTNIFNNIIKQTDTNPKYDNNIFNTDGKSKIKSNNRASNKKTVLKILGSIFAILGIVCIILSWTIAESVLLSLLIPGCVLFVAGISILVGLFLNNKHDKSINLYFGYKRQDLISEDDQNNKRNKSINMEIEKYKDPTYEQ